MAKVTKRDEAVVNKTAIDSEVVATASPISAELIISEQAVLGAILNASKVNDVGLVSQIFSQVKEDDFSLDEHKQIFKASLHLSQKGGVTPDTATVAHYVSQLSNGLTSVKAEYIYALEHQARNEIAQNFTYHLENIRKTGSLKELSVISREIASLSLRKGVESIDSIIEESISLIKSVKREQHDRPALVSDSLSLFIDDLDKRFRGELSGHYSNYEDLDEKLGPLEDGNLVVIGGRPSMGKTTFALNLVRKYSIQRNVKLASHIFSLEMPEQQIIRSFTGMLGNVNISHLKSGKIQEDAWAGISSAISMLDGVPVTITEKPRITPYQIRKYVEQSIEQFGTKIVVIDYLQLVQPNRETGNRATDVGEISRELKIMAKELGVVVILLAQLSRELEKRPNKRPLMSDLRESGAIEQDADVIIFIYRDEIYNPDTEFPGVAEIIIGKNRSGEVGDVRMLTVLQFAQFNDFMANFEEFRAY